VVVALAAAVIFGLSDVVEQRGTHKVPERPALSPRLLLDLAKERVWLAAIGVNILRNYFYFSERTVVHAPRRRSR
jgi:hypothetical protein